MLKFGNNKLPDSTLIFNMSTAKECPAKLLGLCDVVNRGIRCYAEKAEVTYPAVTAYRTRQNIYWNGTPAQHIYSEFLHYIKNRRKETKAFRFNESGDFASQDDIHKLDEIAKLLAEHGVVTYGYTARQDLDFTGVSFIVRGSGFGDDKRDRPGLKGITKVVDKTYVREPGWIICPGSCKTCSLCSSNVNVNIAFRKH